MSLLGSSREIRVFIVDTDPDLVQTLQTYFQTTAADNPGERPIRNVGVAYTGQDCQTELKLAGAPPDVFLINAHLPDISGIELVKRLHLVVDKPLVVMLLPDGFQHLTLDARQAGAARVIPLPCTVRQVENAIREVFEERHLHREMPAEAPQAAPPAASAPPASVPPASAPPAPARSGGTPPGFDSATVTPPSLFPGGEVTAPDASVPDLPAAPGGREHSLMPGGGPAPELDPGAAWDNTAPPVPDSDLETPDLFASRSAQPTGVRGMKTGRQIIAFFSGKGGVGKTTLISNLAHVLARHTDIPLLVADFDLDNPSLHAHWFVEKNDYDLSDLRDVKSKLDKKLLMKILYPYRRKDPASGKKQRELQILFLPGFVKQTYVDDFTEQDVDRLLAVMQEVSPLVLIDLSSHLSDRLVARVLEKCTKLVLVLDQDMSAVENTLRFVETFRRLRVGTEKIIPVINKLVPYGAPVARIERALGLKIAVTIPYDHKLFLTAITDAKPVVLENYQHPIVEPFVQLATLIVPSLKVDSARKSQQKKSLLSSLRLGFGSKDRKKP